MIYFLIECNTNNHDCDSKAMCIAIEDSFKCHCNAGYTGNGKTCSDINECSTNDHDCDENAICKNLSGGPDFFSCSCLEGYKGDGKTCLKEKGVSLLPFFFKNQLTS